MILNAIAVDLDSDKNLDNVILFRRDERIVTDSNSGDENEAGILHLPSRRLLSQVFMRIKTL